MSESIFKRLADSAIQKNRKPISNQAEFRHKVEECQQYLNRDPKAAVTLAQELVEMEPERGLPWLLLSMSLGYSGNPEEALKAINQAIRIDPTDSQKWEVKALSLGDLGREDELREAIAEMKRLRECENSAQHRSSTEEIGNFKKK